MPKINRESLLNTLQAVSPGLSAREVFEQAGCFVFQGGKVFTFNDEVYCCAQSGLPLTLQCAVHAKPLLELLAKFTEDIELQSSDSELIVLGKRRRAGIKMEAEINLPVHEVEQPVKWRALPAEFDEVLSLVITCASDDASRFSLTCVHFDPEFIEACDNSQLCRSVLHTGIKEPFLARAAALKGVLSLPVYEMCETKAWLHFRTKHEVILSCRRYLEEYPDMTETLEVAGDTVVLPGGLGEAIEKAKIFTNDNTSENKVFVTLKPGKMILKGQGVFGWYKEFLKIPYSGKPLTFLVAPDLLAEISRKYKSCVVSPDRLKVDGDNYHYITSLAPEPEESAITVEETPARKKKVKNATEED